MNEHEIAEALKQLAAGVPGFWEMLVGEYAAREWFSAGVATLFAAIPALGFIFLLRKWPPEDTERKQGAFLVGGVVCALALFALVFAAGFAAAAISPNYSMLKELVG